MEAGHCQAKTKTNVTEKHLHNMIQGMMVCAFDFQIIRRVELTIQGSKMIGSAKYSKDSPRVREWASRKEAPWHASAGRIGRHPGDRLEGSRRSIDPASC